MYLNGYLENPTTFQIILSAFLTPRFSTMTTTIPYPTLIPHFSLYYRIISHTAVLPWCYFLINHIQCWYKWVQFGTVKLQPLTLTSLGWVGFSPGTNFLEICTHGQERFKNFTQCESVMHKWRLQAGTLDGGSPQYCKSSFCNSNFSQRGPNSFTVF